jgi:Enoyl-CoA hydratase/carnithine racemase
MTEVLNMKKDLILAEREGLIGTISINNPAKNNAITKEMFDKIDDILRKMEEEEIRVVIIKGGGDSKFFSSGYDIGTFSDHVPPPEETLKETVEKYEKDHYKVSLRTIESIGMPVIAMINGHCIGAGADLSSACDFRYAASGLKIGLPPVKINIIYNEEGIGRAIRTVGLARAKEMFFLGNYISSEEAYALGFLNRVLPMEELEEFTMGIAKSLVETAPLP